MNEERNNRWTSTILLIAPFPFLKCRHSSPEWSVSEVFAYHAKRLAGQGGLGGLVAYCWRGSGPSNDSSGRTITDARRCNAPEHRRSIDGNRHGSTITLHRPGWLGGARKRSRRLGARHARRVSRQGRAGRRGNAIARAIDVLTLVHHLVPVLGPDVEVADRDVGRGHDVGAADDDGAARDAVVDCAGPIAEGEAAEGYRAGVGRSVAFPVLVNVLRMEMFG